MGATHSSCFHLKLMNKYHYNELNGKTKKLHGNESFEIIPKWPKGKKFLPLMTHKTFNPAVS